MKHILLILFLTLSYLLAKDPRIDQNDPAFKLYFQAYEFVLDENWDSAIKSFNELTKKYNNSDYYDDAFYWIAYATNEKGELDKAYDLLKSFISKFPNSNLKENAARDIKIIANHQISKGENRSKYEADLKRYKDERDESDEEIELQESALFAIYNQGGKASRDKLFKIVMNKNRPVKVREKALFWLGQSDEVTVKKLLEIYDSLESVKLKEKCIFGISQKNEKEGQEALLKISLDEASELKLREKAIFWLSQTERSSGLSFYTQLLNKIKDRRLREKIIFGISQLGTTESHTLLTKIAFDKKENLEVREKAIFWLGQSGDVDNLKKIYLQVEEKKLKEKLVFSFSQASSEEAIDFMVKLLKNKTTSTRIKKKIVFWLGQSDHPKSKKAIQEILED